MFKGDYYVSWRFILVSSVSWILIFALTVSESLFYYQVNQKPAPYKNILVNDLFILTWLPVSIILFAVIQSWYNHKSRWLTFSLKLVGLGILVLALLIGIESCIHYIDRLGSEYQRQWSDIYLQLISFRFHSNLVLYLGFCAISVAYLAYRETKRLSEKEAALRKDLVEAQLGVLKEQMKPHFLFNSLHAISGLILKNKNELAISVITKLSDLLRESLTMDHKQWISLSDEINFLERYLEIYSMRFGDQLNYTFEVEAAIEEARIPPMILQPIVENALVHGIVPNDNQGNIDISGKMQDGFLLLEVRDSSIESEHEIGEHEEGLGLGNTRKRLTSLYGTDFELTLNFDPEQHETIAHIKLPLQFI